MRVTNSMIFDSLTSKLLKNNQNLLKTYETLSSGKRVNRPSDDPVGTTSILGYKKVISNLNQYERNIQYAKDYLVNSETALSDVSNVLSRLKELAVENSSASATAATRLSASNEVQELFNGLISAGNTKLGGKYLFSGYRTTTPPFVAGSVYAGDSNTAAVKVGEGTTFTYGLDGNSIFGDVTGSGLYYDVSNFQAALVADNDNNIQLAIDTMETSISTIGNTLAQVGGRLNRLSSEDSLIENFKIETKIALSEIEDADFTEVVTELAMQQTVMEALQVSVSKALQLNIFRFIG